MKNLEKKNLEKKNLEKKNLEKKNLDKSEFNMLININKRKNKRKIKKKNIFSLPKSFILISYLVIRIIFLYFK
jgi:hypothetical protein